MFGAGPGSVSTFLAASVLGFGLLPQTGNRRAVWFGAAFGALALLGAQPALSLLPSGAVPVAALALVTLATWATAPLLACQSLALNPLSGSLLLLGGAAGWTLDSTVAVLLAIMLGGLARLARGGTQETAAVGLSPSFASIGARTVCFSVLVLAMGLAWVLLRGPLLPAAGSTVAVLGAVVVGLASPPGPWVGRIALLLGAGGAGGLVFFGLGLREHMGDLALALVALSPRLAEADAPALVVMLGLGASGGLLLRGIAARPREQAVGTLIGALLLPLALPLMTTRAAAAAGSALVSVGADPGVRSRLDSQRARLPLQHALVTTSGASLIRGKKGELLAELDGSIVDPDSRGAEGERFAGTLGACLVADRTSARVAGDDLGLAVTALLAQGFRSVDTAVPDSAWMQAWANLSPSALGAWVHPATRIVPLAAPFVAQGGARASVVINILRNGWSDARQVIPNSRALAASRRSLRPGGVYVLSVTTKRIDADAFLGLGHALAEAFPSLTLWLPPVGVDTALFVGSAEPAKQYDWTQLDVCIANERDTLRRVAIRTASDLAGLLLGDQSTIPNLPAPTGRRMPQRLASGEASPLARIEARGWDPTRAWTGLGEQASDLRARHDSLLAFQETLAHAAAGDMQAAVVAARSLSTAPGGGRSVETLIRGYLDQARTLIERAGREGPDSRSWGAAETALGNARLLYPDLAETWCVQARMDELRGQLPRSEEAYATCSEKDPDSLEALDGLGRTRSKGGNLPGAEQAMRAAVERHPEAWPSKLNLGVLYISLRRYPEAEPLLRAAVADSAHSTEPQLKPHLALASLYLATDRPALALGEANAVTSLQPSANALALRGEARLHLNQPAEAERDFRAALELNPEWVPARGGLGHVQALNGDYDGAVASFKAVLALDPQNAAARANLQKLAQLGKE